jgi:hypothetical protein
MGTEIPVVTAIALIRAETNRITDPIDAISGKKRLQEGIAETETMIAFQASSRLELETGFELGLD